MLDDLARALRQSHLQDLPRKDVYAPGEGFDEIEDQQRQNYRRMVRAVLYRLKQGSPEVFRAGFKVLSEEGSIEEILAAMIEAVG